MQHILTYLSTKFYICFIHSFFKNYKNYTISTSWKGFYVCYIKNPTLDWFYGISNIVGYLRPNPFLYIRTVLFQTIQFSISTQFSSNWPIDRTPSGATTLVQSGYGSDSNEGVLCIPQSSSFTEASPLDCLVSYPGHSLGESYPSAEIQSVYYTVPADWAKPDF